MSTRNARATDFEAAVIAVNTTDAYSYNRYGARSWYGCCCQLARRGYTATQIEWIMRSKWTRWAADEGDHEYGRHTPDDLTRWLDKQGVTPENCSHKMH